MSHSSPTPAPQFADERPYSATWDDGTRTMYAHGTVDEISASAFRDDLLRRVQALDTGFVVDLSDVDFFPSAAVGALIAGLKAAAGRQQELRIRVDDGTIAQRVLRICGLDYEVS